MCNNEVHKGKFEYAAIEKWLEKACADLSIEEQAEIVVLCLDPRQKDLIRNMLNQRGQLGLVEHVRLKSVEEFQGQEAEVVFLSFYFDTLPIPGILKFHQLLLVALTRA
eukprot:Pgem_evm1s13251